MRIIPRATLASVGIGAICLALAGTALADPPSGTVPTVNDIVGVGSDTTQSVIDQVSADYNAQSPAPTRKLYSFDAVGSATITTKPAVPRSPGRTARARESPR